jgi:hypothetical protein
MPRTSLRALLFFKKKILRLTTFLYRQAEKEPQGILSRTLVVKLLIKRGLELIPDLRERFSLKNNLS